VLHHLFFIHLTTVVKVFYFIADFILCCGFLYSTILKQNTMYTICMW